MDATEVLQDFLDRLGEIVIAGRLECYQRHVHLPFVLETATAKLRIVTPAELEEGFDTFSEMLADLGVTRMQRLVIRAFSPAPDAIHGQYTTRLLAGNVQVAPMFWSQIRLTLVDGVWKTAYISNNTTDARWPVMMPNVYQSKD